MVDSEFELEQKEFDIPRPPGKEAFARISGIALGVRVQTLDR